jgi:hypothetical protein
MKDLLPLSWKSPDGPLSRAEARSIIWRQDMAGYVLQHMKKDTVKELKKACLVGQKLEDKTGVWRVLDIGEGGEKGLHEGLRKIGELDQMACGGVLVLKSASLRNREQCEQDGENISECSGPLIHPRQTEILPPSLPLTTPSPTIPEASRSRELPDFIALPNEGTQVPVFDLTHLLSDHDLEELRQHHPRFQQDALFFRPGGNVPVDAMLAMWRLKGYLIHDREFQRGI